MAALNRATKANYVVHDRIQAETTDREDHTFCGIMFPVKCKSILPIDHVIINSVAVRGALGPLTVWVTKNESLNGEIPMTKKSWRKIYEKTHRPSRVGYKELDFSENPIILRPGQVKGIYIHSTRRGDEAIVYDNKVKQKTHDDSFITILPGRAHVSEKVFGAIPIWGWGSAWRDNREFVGQINYGAVYKLWNPAESLSFGENFRSAARCLLMCQRRSESPFAKLPDECIYYILNMCRWDWVNDTSDEMRRSQKQARRLARQRMEEEADHLLNDAAAEGGVAGASDGVADVEDEDEDEFMEEDSNVSDEDSDGSESAASEEYAWGDHVSARDALVFNVEDSEESEDDVEFDREEWRHQSRFQHRGSLLGRSFLRARAHIFDVLNGGAHQGENV
ncbi:hypothetical protein HJC23_006351 [Cyclotella cryptica]|uniref:Uncharacterized protein n=1 Tax=Cyclotella cryptica TaxID=29204 RepID=A0ABD3QA45_9STRA|eukprot:CCRYP_008746-RA/>CCRYP_008746-RA protein AED:0.38 eAED:0.38 QI:151/1/1/1/1/1/4/601/392